MTQSPVTRDVTETCDVLLHLSTKLALDHVALLNHTGDSSYLVLGEVTGFGGPVDPGLLENQKRRVRPHSVNVTECNIDPFVIRHVNAGNSWHLATPFT
jgi:hypothetical protein